MRILLDECLPVDFLHDLALGGHIETASFAGLAGVSNGALLDAMNGRFDVLITIDGGIRYQQSIAARSVAVMVLRAPTNAIDDIRPLVPAIWAALSSVKPGTVVGI